MKEEYVKVTLKIPRAIADLYNAARQLSKSTVTFEQWLYNRMVWGLPRELTTIDPENVLGISGPALVDAYNLNDILKEG